MAKYWVGGTGSWSTAGRWSTQSGKAQFTASRPSGTNATLTVSSVQSGTIASGQLLYDSAGTARGSINAQLSGTTGGAGTYSTTASSATIASGSACYTMASGSNTTAPATTDTGTEIIFDANSGVSPTVTVTTTGYSGLLIIGAYTASGQSAGYTAQGNLTSDVNGTLTLAGTSTLNCYGGLQVSATSTVSWTHYGTFNFTTYSGNISAPNCNIASAIVIPSGTWTLTGNVGNSSHWSKLSSGTYAGTLTQTGGTLNLGTYTWTAITYSATGSTSKTLNFGTSGALSLSCTPTSVTNINAVNITSSASQLSIQGTDPLFILSGNPTENYSTRTVLFTSSTWHTASTSSNPYPGLKVTADSTNYGYVQYTNSGASTTASGWTIYLRTLDLTGMSPLTSHSAYIFHSYNNQTMYLMGDFLIPRLSGFSINGAGTYRYLYFIGENKKITIDQYAGYNLVTYFYQPCSYTQVGDFGPQKLYVPSDYNTALGTYPLTLNNTGKIGPVNGNTYAGSYALYPSVKLIGDINARDAYIVDMGFNDTSLTSIQAYYFSSSQATTKSYNIDIVTVINGYSMATAGLELGGGGTYTGNLTFTDPNNTGNTLGKKCILNSVTLTKTLNFTGTEFTLSGTNTIPSGCVANLKDAQIASAVLTTYSSGSTNNPVTVNMNLTNARYLTDWDSSQNTLTCLGSAHVVNVYVTGTSNNNLILGSNNLINSLNCTGYYGAVLGSYTRYDSDGNSYSGDYGISIANSLIIPSTALSVNFYTLTKYGSASSITVDIPTSSVVRSLTLSSDLSIVNPFTVTYLTVNSGSFTQATTVTCTDNITANGSSTINLGNSTTNLSLITLNSTSTLNFNTYSGTLTTLDATGTVNFNSSTATVGTITAYSAATVNFNSSTPTISTYNNYGTINSGNNLVTINIFYGNSGTANFNKLTITDFIQNNNSNSVINFNDTTNIRKLVNSAGTINCNSSTINLTGDSNNNNQSYINGGTLNLGQSTFTYTYLNMSGSGGTINIDTSTFTGEYLNLITGTLNLTNKTINVKDLYVSGGSMLSSNYLSGSTINLSGILYTLNTPVKFNKVVVKSSAVSISTPYIAELSNTVTPTTVTMRTDCTFDKFNLQGTENNLVKVISNIPGNQRILKKPDLWNIGTHSINRSNNSNLFLFSGTNDYLDFTDIYATVPQFNFQAAPVTIEYRNSSFYTYNAYSGENYLDVTLYGGGSGRNSTSDYWVYRVTVPAGNVCSWTATLYSSSELNYDYAYLYVNDVQIGSRISGFTGGSGSVSVQSSGTITGSFADFKLAYVKDGSLIGGADYARLYVTFTPTLTTSPSKFFLIF